MNSPTDPTGHTPGEPTEGWWKRRSRAAKMGIVVAALAAAGGIGGALSDDTPGQPEPTAATTTAPPTTTASEEPGQEPEPVADNFTISYDDYDGTTTVAFEIPDNFTRGQIAAGAERATINALEAAVTEHPDTSRVVIEGTFPTVDDHGNENPDSVILRPFYDRDTIDRINFDNQHAIDIWAIRDGGMVHPDLID